MLLPKKLSELVKIWKSYFKNNFAWFFETWCIYLYYHYADHTVDCKLCYKTSCCRLFIILC